jgi:hypothetical protein
MEPYPRLILAFAYFKTFLLLLSSRQRAADT